MKSSGRATRHDTAPLRQQFVMVVGDDELVPGQQQLAARITGKTGLLSYDLLIVPD